MASLPRPAHDTASGPRRRLTQITKAVGFSPFSGVLARIVTVWGDCPLSSRPAVPNSFRKATVIGKKLPAMDLVTAERFVQFKRSEVPEIFEKWGEVRRWLGVC